MTFMFCKAGKKCAQLKLILISLLILGMNACAQEQNTSVITGSPTVTPFSSPTVTPKRETATPLPERATPLPTSPPLPTPTPLTYNVVEGDTLLGVALRHGVTLDELLAANPGVDPNFLTIGLTLTIPIEEGAQTALATPTPLPLPLSTPHCYPSADNGLWCLTAVKNTTDQPVENISAKLILYTSDADSPLVKVAYPPLNLLAPGRTLPLVAFFSPPAPGDVQPIFELLTALPISSEGNRYKDVNLIVQEQSISEDKILARIKGTLILSSDSEAVDLVWLVAIAYNSDGNIVGVRKWESGKGINPGEGLAFEMAVFSLGPPIQRVELLVEAR
jgi:LysM repeat protein